MPRVVSGNGHIIIFAVACIASYHSYSILLVSCNKCIMRSIRLLSVLSACLILGITGAFQPLRALQVYPRIGIRRVEHPTIAPSARRRSECFTWQTQSPLYSLKTLMDDLSDSSMSGTRTVFVGGKGTMVQERTLVLSSDASPFIT